MESNNPEFLKEEIRKTRNDLSFLFSDRGGADHTQEMNLLRDKLTDLQQKLKNNAD